MNKSAPDYVILGLNHKTALIEIRERLSFSRDNLKKAVEQVALLPSIEECFILSTCNRVEIHAASLSPGAALSELRNFFSDHSGLNGELTPHLYAHSGLQAVHHLFRVTSSLDSMIVGEAQITGQVKTAFGLAHELGCARLFLKRILNKALSVGKRIRTDTVISNGSVSYGSVAVDLGESIFEPISDKSVVLIGAGKIGSLVMEAMGRKGVKEVCVLNRTIANAAVLAGNYRHKVLNEANLKAELTVADMVISSVETRSPLIGPTQLHSVMKERKNRPLLLIDLGIPRNIDRAAGNFENVYLYDIDDLDTIIQKNLSVRASEACKAETMALAQAVRFYERMQMVSERLRLAPQFFTVNS